MPAPALAEKSVDDFDDAMRESIVAEVAKAAGVDASKVSRKR